MKFIRLTALQGHSVWVNFELVVGFWYSEQYSGTFIIDGPNQLCDQLVVKETPQQILDLIKNRCNKLISK